MFTLIVIGSAICGWLTSIFFISQNNYTSENTNEGNKSMLFGIAWALLQSSLIFGNLFSMLYIESLGQFNYFCVMTGVSAFTVIFFAFLRKPVQ